MRKTTRSVLGVLNWRGNVWYRRQAVDFTTAQGLRWENFTSCMSPRVAAKATANYRWLFRHEYLWQQILLLLSWIKLGPSFVVSTPCSRFHNGMRSPLRKFHLTNESTRRRESICKIWEIIQPRIFMKIITNCGAGVNNWVGNMVSKPCSRFQNDMKSPVRDEIHLLHESTRSRERNCSLSGGIQKPILVRKLSRNPQGHKFQATSITALSTAIDTQQYPRILNEEPGAVLNRSKWTTPVHHEHADRAMLHSASL